MNTKNEEQEIDAYEQLANFMIALIGATPWSDEEKAGWIAVLPFMQPPDILKLIATIQAGALEALEKEYPEAFKEMEQMLKEYEAGQQKINDDTMRALEDLEKDIENETI